MQRPPETLAKLGDHQSLNDGHSHHSRSAEADRERTVSTAAILNARLLEASRALHEANLELDRAQKRFHEAVHALDMFEAAQAPTYQEVRGILK